MKAHHIGLLGLISLWPGIYAYRQASDFFYTRREALVQVKRVDEMIEDRKALYEKLVELDEKITKIQGMLEVYFAKKQMQKSRVYSKEEFGLKNAKKEKI